MKKKAGLALAGILLVGGLVFLLRPPRFVLNALKRVEPTPEVGRALVEKYGCRGCHQIGGMGATMAPSLDGITTRMDPAGVPLRLWLRNPRAIKPSTNMPNFHLSDSEIEAIIAYLSALDRGEIAP